MIMTRTVTYAALLLVVLCVGGGEGQFLCSRQQDIIIAVDVSGSITRSDFTKQQAFLRQVVDAIAISATSAARFVIFGFDHNTNSIASSFEDRAARWRNLIKQQITSLQLTMGATTIEEAITEAKRLFNTTSRNVPRRVVFLTDGVNYGGTESLRQPAQELRTLFGARVVGLGVGPANTINTEAFEILTGRPDRHFILRFKNSNSCSGDDDDCECSDTDDDDEGEEDDDDDGNCGNSEVKRAVKLICG